MNPIPTAEDWVRDPAGALLAATAVAKTTAADTDSQTVAIAMGIAAQVVQAAAPLIGSALGGPAGALAAAGLAQVAFSLTSQHASALEALTPAQQALVALSIQTGAGYVAAKLPAAKGA